MNIVGVSAFYHDSAAALIRDGEILAAAQEERFTRKKNDHDFPVNAPASAAPKWTAWSSTTSRS
jgi:carbamoyltransferase